MDNMKSTKTLVASAGLLAVHARHHLSKTLQMYLKWLPQPNPTFT